MNEFITFLLLVFGVLQIVLCFKIWQMTNDVREMKQFFIHGEKPSSTSEGSSAVEPKQQIKQVAPEGKSWFN